MATKKKSSTRWLSLAGLYLLVVPLSGLAQQPPNIVFILTDNQSAEALSIYGNRDVRMPNVEALAERGLRFDQAFAASGMCSPTRATLLTGLMPSQHGLHNALHDAWVDNLEPGWSAVEEFATVPAMLNAQGYQTAMIGKWHIGDPKSAQLGYQHWIALPYGHTRDFWHNQLIENGKLVDVSGQHIVDVLAARAADYIGQVDNGAPFFLQLSLDGPYALPPTNYGAAKNVHYQPPGPQPYRSMPREPVNDQLLSRLSGPFIPQHAIENGIEGMGLGEIWNSILYRTIRMQGDRQSYANFLSQNTVVDDAVGRVWQALEARGLTDNTVIIYAADQGNLFGQHGSWGHTIWFSPAHLYDTAMRVPLVVYHPDMKTADRATGRLIGQYDIAPTILELAGIDSAIENSPGISFVDTLLEQPSPAAHEAVFFEQEESRGIRTPHYAYWKRAQGMGEAELYDLQQDPMQQRNIYPAQADSALVRELDTQLEAFFASYSSADYNLWTGGVSKGTNPNPMPWIKAYPWPWIKKMFGDWLASQ